MDKMSSGEDRTQLDTDYRICCQRINRALTISFKRHVILSQKYSMVVGSAAHILKLEQYKAD